MRLHTMQSSVQMKKLWLLASRPLLATPEEFVARHERLCGTYGGAVE